MTSKKPLPQAGPWLGRLTTLAPSASAEARLLDPIRLDLVDGVFDAGPDPVRWLEQFQDAARRGAAVVVEEARGRVTRAAAESRLPARRLAAELPGEEDAAVILNRALAAGIPLEALTGHPDAGVARLGGALQAAWAELESALVGELHRWTAVAARVRAWRRDRRPLRWITAAVVTMVLWLGLATGGYLPAPGPISVFRDWWWSLPWP